MRRLAKLTYMAGAAAMALKASRSPALGQESDPVVRLAAICTSAVCWPLVLVAGALVGPADHPKVEGGIEPRPLP